MYAAKNPMRVTIYLQVYNTKPFLNQCVNSILSQTYNNFECIIADNGSTDGCEEILEAYAKQDQRITLIRYEQNQRINFPQLIQRYGTGEFFTNIDSDDWWEPNYLEHMVKFMEENDLDLAITGTVQYLETHHLDQLLRKLDSPIILTQEQFADKYPIFWTFPSTVWASVQKMSIYKADFKTPVQLAYGGDTMHMLEYIKHCTRIGIDSSALYHYRIHPKGMSYQYDPRRFDANIVYYEQIKEFLELHQTFDPSKQEWLKRVHLASMSTTLGMLRDAQVTEEEKLAECARIVKHPLTAVALTNHCDERTQWLCVMWETVFSALTEKGSANQENLYEILHFLSPRCCKAVRIENLALFSREPDLFDALQRDDWDGLVCQLMGLIAQKRYSKQYDLGEMLEDMIPDKTPLKGVTDTRFFREYADICMLILCENYAAALDQMTGLLLEKKKLYTAEQFLELYLSLAALEDQAPAFLFGKLRLAELYLHQDRLKECRAVADELMEIGVDNEELSELRQALEERS